MNTMTDDAELLYVTAVDSKPVEIDWQEAAGDDGDGVTWWQTFDYESELGDRTLVAENGYVIGWVEDGSYVADTDGEYSGVEPYEWGAEGPMMNYFYPLELRGPNETDRAAAAAAVDGLPLCFVEVDGTTGLALTGGGMDLSWDICRAFIRLGYLPPTHFADLPNYAGEKDPEVIAAMRRALEVQMGWLRHRLDRLTELAT